MLWLGTARKFMLEQGWGKRVLSLHQPPPGDFLTKWTAQEAGPGKPETPRDIFCLGNPDAGSRYDISPFRGRYELKWRRIDGFTAMPIRDAESLTD